MSKTSENIFDFKKRSLVHFAVDTETVHMTTRQYLYQGGNEPGDSRKTITGKIRRR